MRLVKYMADKSAGKSVITSISTDCTNNCLMCNVSAPNPTFKTESRESVMKRMVDKRKEGYDTIHFTGGEPTRSKDLTDFITEAKRLGYSRIEMSSNACSLADKAVAEDLVARGLNGVTTSLHGHNAKLHDAITRTPGSFDSTVAGIENLCSGGKVDVSVGTVLMRLNCNSLGKIGEMILSFGITKWSFLDLKPIGRAGLKGRYESLVAKRSDLAREIGNSLNTISKFDYIGAFDCNWCLFPKDLTNVFFFETANIEDNCKTDVTMTSRDSRSTIDRIHDDESKEHLPMCEGCLFSDRCKGVWKLYLDIYGDSDIMPFEKYSFET